MRCGHLSASRGCLLLSRSCLFPAISRHGLCMPLLIGPYLKPLPSVLRYLREYLNLPADMVPNTLKKSTRHLVEIV